MITIAFIIFSFFVIYQINSQIRRSEIKKFPELKISENEKNIGSKTSAVGYIGLFVMLLGILYINFIYKTETEKKSEIATLKVQNVEKDKRDKAQSVILKKAASDRSYGLSSEEVEILSQHQMKVYSLEDEVANAYKILKSDFYFVDTEKIRFSGLAKKAKGTSYEKRVLKTRDSLFTNEHKIAQRQIRDSETKSNNESSNARKKYGEDFRNILLDKGLNIKVLVYGKDNKKLKLTYALFDEVWFRKFQNEGYFDRFNEQGFNYIELTDGYDYGQYLKY